MDESKTGRESPINPGDSPEAVFRKKRYRFLCGLRRRSRSRPGTPSTVGNGVLFLPLERHDLFQQSFEKVTLDVARVCVAICGARAIARCNCSSSTPCSSWESMRPVVLTVRPFPAADVFLCHAAA